MIIRIKGSASSGWYSPPRGTHSGEKHRQVGSGKAIARKKVVQEKPKQPAAPKKPGAKPEPPGAMGMGIEKAQEYADRLVRMKDERGRSSTATAGRRAKIAKLLALHPESAMENLRYVDIAKNKDAWGEMLWGVNITSSPSAVAGAYHDLQRRMVLPASFSATTFHHEVGHALLRSAGDPARVGWNTVLYRDKKFDRHTEYSKTNYSEAFCEAYAAYVKTGGVAKSARYIATFAAVKDVIDAA